MRTAVVLFIFLFLSFFSYSQSNLELIQQKIFDGEIESAIRLVDKSIGNDSKINAQLLKLKGDAFIASGDVEAALIWWKKSNVIRSKAYLKDDYHLAWNHALLSSYYYEKMNTSQAIQHADSCMQLISNLSISQQKEIQIYRIWNILAQSYKQSGLQLSFTECKKLYQKVQGLYLQSVDFIQKNEIDERYLADTYHLLGNSYVDLIMQYIEHEPKQGFFNYQLSSSYYEKAITISKKLYGNQHAKVARTYFVQGLLNKFIDNQLGFDSRKIALDLFEKTLNAYSANLTNGARVDLKKIVNKASFLMACKHFQVTYLKAYEETGFESLLQKSEIVNQISIQTWEEIHQSFKGINTNQNLAIYHLVPFTETIKIELLKKEVGVPFSMDKFFAASQKLKYYDLLKLGDHRNNRDHEISISQLQEKLKSDEVFLDFYAEVYSEQILILRITANSRELIEIKSLPVSLVDNFLKAIEKTDFDAYTKTALKIHQLIIQPCKIGDKKVILCLDSWLNAIPFTSLLTSKNNWDKKDYRQLDYLLKKNQIQYILNPQMFRSTETHFADFKIDTYIPKNKSFAALPFSDKLGEKLRDKHRATLYSKSKASKNSFLNMNSSIVHLSGHGIISNQNVLTNHLVFSDSMLYLDELTKLKNAPRLIILNTCNSSNGMIFLGEGVNSFARTLSRLGVDAILSNLWEVDDQASNQLLEDFYDQLSNNQSTIKSLRKAQLTRISEAKNSNLSAPYYWAGHQLIGDEIVFDNEKKTMDLGKFFKWIIGLFVLGFGIWYWKQRRNKFRKNENPFNQR